MNEIAEAVTWIQQLETILREGAVKARAELSPACVALEVAALHLHMAASALTAANRIAARERGAAG